MATTIAKSLDLIIATCRNYFSAINIIRHDIYKSHAILQLEAAYGQYHIRIREILITDGTRKYSYYIFINTEIIAGFDNASDPEALRLKYGKNYTQHRLELIPHAHSAGKQTVRLTEELHCVDFLAWVKQNLD